MLGLAVNKKKNITDFGFLTGLLFLILLDFINNPIFVFGAIGIMFLALLNCLKIINHIEGMRAVFNRFHSFFIKL